MAWPKKNTNRITVDDTVYLWRVKPYTLELALTVQPESESGCYLYVIFPEDQRVTPSIVRQFIVDALALGWMSGDTTPKNFWMRGADGVRDFQGRDWRN